MTNDIDKNVIEAIRALYRRDTNAQALFDQLAKRRRDATETSVDTFGNLLSISRGAAVDLARALGETGCGEFIVGRKGHQSRFAWTYSCISLGRAAAGEAGDLEKAVDPLPELEVEIPGNIEAAPPAKTLISISEAKKMLAASLGVDVANIEITVRV